MLTRDQLAAWLGQVHADGELSAHIFKLAFRLTQIVDAAGFVRSAAAANLPGHVGDAAELIGDLLGRLIARGHLEAIGSGPKIKGFRLVVRPTPTPLKRRVPKTARLIPFPAARRRAFIEKQARIMAGMSVESADGYLRAQLTIQGDAMRRKGIEEAAIAPVLRDLQRAIRGEVFRAVLLRDPQEPA